MIYPLLSKLESDGYILGSWSEPEKHSVKTYRITVEGLRHYDVIKRQYEHGLKQSLKIINLTLKDIYDI